MVERLTEGERIVLELEGEEVEHGIQLASLASFIDNFRRALVDFDRARRAERTRRGGAPNVREQLVTAFRVVRLEPGSAIIDLVPTGTQSDDQDQIEGAKTLAVENLRSFLDTIEGIETLEPDVTEALAAARRALGPHGRIGVVLAGTHLPRRVEIDEARVDELAARKPRSVRTATRVTGRLHMVDVDPLRVGIRSPSGIEWFCTYPEELEAEVRDLLKRMVSAGGRGRMTSPGRGEFEIAEIEAIPEYEQTLLFALEAKPLRQLLEEQHITEPQGWDVFADPEWQEDEAARVYLEAVLGTENGH